MSLFSADCGKSVGGEASGLKNGLRRAAQEGLQRGNRLGPEGDDLAQASRPFGEISQPQDGSPGCRVPVLTRPGSIVARGGCHGYLPAAAGGFARPV